MATKIVGILDESDLLLAVMGDAVRSGGRYAIL